MDTAEKHIINTLDLSIGYASKRATSTIAQHINIELQEGHFVCLLGKNGIGKSTLLRTLTKVQPQLKGDIFIKSKKLVAINNTELSKNISVVLTEKLPENNLSVFELVALGRQPYTNWIGNLTDTDIDFIQQALKQTNTLHLANNKCFELSDGQLQKVLIARALAQNTPIIVLDEPTAHLDIHHTIETFSLLKKLTETHHKTIIISTHEINLSLQLADELWLMTPSNFISGKVEKLIEADKLDLLFDSDLIHFDKNLKQFIISGK